MFNLHKYNTLKIKEYILLGIVSATLLVIFFSHNYGDLLVTTRHGMNLWGILFDGNIRDFYQINIVNSGNDFYLDLYYCVYNIVVYIVFAVWNIPLVILEILFKVDVMNNVLCLSWAKLLPVTFFILTTIVLYKITEQLYWEKKLSQLSIFLYTSSILTIASVFIASQYDSIGLFFSMLGVLAFFKGQYKKFILWFAIALCFKFFALLIFIPLLLIKQKRIFKIMRDCFIVLSLYILTNAFFASSTGETTSFASQMLKDMIATPETRQLNFVIIMSTLICIYCYIFNAKSIEHQNNFAVWAIFVLSGSFFLFSPIHPYWIVLLLPFLTLIIVQDKNKLKNNLFLELVLGASIVIKQMVMFSWVFWGNTMKTMLLSQIIPGVVHDAERYSNSLILRIFYRMEESQSIPSLMMSITCATFFALIIYNRPRIIQQEIVSSDNLLNTECWEMLIVRTIIFCLIGLIPIISLFI